MNEQGIKKVDEYGNAYLTRQFIHQLNKDTQKYCGWKEPQEIRNLWDELYNKYGIEIIIMGYPNDVAADGAKCWQVNFEYGGYPIVNSVFVYSVYEGSNSLKNDYNIYFS